LPGFLIPVHHMHIETAAPYHGSLPWSRVMFIISCCAFAMVFLYSPQILACIIRLTTVITLLSNICPY